MASESTPTPMHVVTRKLIVEPDENGFLVMHDNGDVEYKRTVAAIVGLVKRIGAESVKSESDVVITTVEWRNMPASFVPPAMP